MGFTDMISEGIESQREYNNAVYANQQARRDAKKAKAADKQARKDAIAAEIKALVDLAFSDDAAELQNQLNFFVSKAAGTKKGFFASATDKQIVSIVKEKMEFGIMKLRSMEKGAEADFFQKKLDALNGQK